MQNWVRRYLSVDDLLSVFGYFLLIILARVANPSTTVAVASSVASGMLAVFWLASESVRTRNLERHPNVRIVVWGAVAAVSIWATPGQ